MGRLNVGGTGIVALDVQSGWTVTREGITVDIEGPGVMVAVANFKRSAFDRFENNERLRYSRLAKEQGIAVVKSDVSLGECVGVPFQTNHCRFR